MFKNYIKIAWRSLWKNKLQTGINLLGLTVGTICCLSIIAYVLAQRGYDTHHKDADSLYRVRTEITMGDGSDTAFISATCSPPIPFTLKEDFPEVIEATRVVYFGEGNDALIRVDGNENGFYETRGYVADSTFFNLFTYSFLEGNGENALVEPNTIVLSTMLSTKLFGDQKALGKNLVIGSGENEMKLTVAGVFNENTGKTHLNPNYIVTMNSPGLGEFVRNERNFATQNFAHGYIKVKPGSTIQELEAKLPAFLQTHGAQNLAEVGFNKKMFLQKVKDIHLYSKGIDNQIDEVSDIQYLYLLLLLALFIQLVACVNFINLSTARANRRAKEIGVRKVVGAHKGSLIRQFLGESVLLSLTALLISIPLTIVVLPFVNLLTEGDLIPADIMSFQVLLPLTLLSLLTGLLAGIYPALVLSSVKPVTVLKGVLSVSSGSGNFRKALVVFQFAISIILIVSVIIINKQVQYSQTKDLGFEKENLIAIHLGTRDAVQKFETLKTEIQSISGIAAVAGTNNYPSKFILGDLGLYLPGQDPSVQTLVKYNGISKGYFETVGSTLLLGRDLRENDSTQIIVNKATLDAFNIPMEKALSSKLLQTYEGQNSEYEIIGVVEDYHFASLKDEIAPIMHFNENEPNWIVVKTESTDFKSLLSAMESSWKSINPITPFKYTFVDKGVEKLFAEEKRLAQISIVFTCLAIVISCLGLFGLISFITEQRKKEIGIRKVLGASVGNVLNMLTQDFVKLICIALCIATPLAWYYLQDWLEGFAYRISIQWWVFVFAGVITVCITLLTISVQAVKAATANPTKSLRTE